MGGLVLGDGVVFGGVVGAWVVGVGIEFGTVTTYRKRTRLNSSH